MNNTEDQQPCLVAKKPCGCFVAAAGLDQPMNLEEITEFYREVGDRAVIEFRPVSFVRNGGLNFQCTHKEKR
jgi:hypothetical protein